MPKTDLQGPHKLTDIHVNAYASDTSSGAYALGRMNGEKFVVSYVGRSDTDLNSRLNDHASTGAYTHFKYGYFSSPKAAFEKECRLYHDFGESDKLDNKIHPARPTNSTLTCPVCDIFD